MSPKIRVRIAVESGLPSVRLAVVLLYTANDFTKAIINNNISDMFIAVIHVQQLLILERLAEQYNRKDVVHQ